MAGNLFPEMRNMNLKTFQNYSWFLDSNKQIGRKASSLMVLPGLLEHPFPLLAASQISKALDHPQSWNSK